MLDGLKSHLNQGEATVVTELGKLTHLESVINCDVNFKL